MKTTFSRYLIVACLFFLAHAAFSQRWMENLERGVHAFRNTNTQAFVTWRILGTEDNSIGFNLYRRTGTATAVKLNTSPITGGTNWQDNGTDFTQDNAYYVTAIVNGAEQGTSPASIIKANTAVQTHPYVGIPLKAITATASDYAVNFVWVGDLDGDGEYDFVVDRIPTVAGLSPKIEAYKRDGTFLWRMDTGPLGENTNNIEGGATTISNGHNDGLTVYDLDNDGKAEVIVKTARDFVFGDGAKMTSSNVAWQYVSVCNGMTGKLISSVQMPTDYLVDGPLQSQFGIAYLDGVNPSVVVKSKNRVGSEGFNLVISTYDFKSNIASQRWKFLRTSTAGGADFHQIRTVDVDGDGKDDVCDGAYVLDENGKVLYNITIANHGDRFHIADIDPDRPGLEGFAIQQDNPTKLGTYYYDAKNGNVLRTYYTPEVADMARGNIGDYDGAHKGYEFWSFNGMYTAQSTTKLVEDADVPWPNFRIWWNGDLLSDFLNETKIDSWVGGRLLTAYKMGAIEAERGAPMFYGDIMGDWREEVIYENSARTELQIFSTPIPSSIRLYTLAHNPAYRNCFTYKGYLQSNNVDYYLGTGMATPPKPNIKLVGAVASCPTNATLDNCGRCIGGTTGKTACASVSEAEDACAFDGITETKNAGFKGASYLNVDNAVGTSITFNITAVNAGTATLSFRYANGGTVDRPAQVSLNGTFLANTLSFPVTGTFTDWKSVDLMLTLLKGNNIMKIISYTSEGLPNIDQIGYVSSGLTKGSCVITGSSNIEIETMNFEIYPNPFYDYLTINQQGNFGYQISTLDGSEIESGKGNDHLEIGHALVPGLYMIKIQTAGTSKSFKFLKSVK